MKSGQSARRFGIIAVVFLLADAAGATDTQTLRVGDVTFDLVRIPPGQAVLGGSPQDRDTRPAYDVDIADGLWMGRTEVTVRQFRAFVDATGYRTDAEKLGWAHTCPLPGMHPHERGLAWREPGFDVTDDQPVVVVSHNDATAFCRWLSEQTGRICRLPTEAQWEYAARVAHQEDPAMNFADVAWYESNSSDGPHPVATRAANPFGLYDTQGNAWEWCLDVWRSNYREATIDGSARTNDPTVPQAVWRYVMRGGGWASPTEHLRFRRRDRRIGSFASPATGFRIAVYEPSRLPVVGNDTSESAEHHTKNKPPETPLRIHGMQFDFVRVPAGEFMMGMEEGGIETPVHKVRIGYDFDMGRTEVTVAQFRAFVEATRHTTDAGKDGVSVSKQGDDNWQTEMGIDWSHPPFEQADDEPVVCVSWYDAMAFCHWLSTETGQEIRLPSEAEWEYACRAGTTGAYAGEVSTMGWHQYNGCNRTHPVAQRPPNAWGLYDMHGNVWEWCLDYFTPGYEGAPADGSPRRDVAIATDVVSRGGSFRNPPGWLGSAVRMGSYPDWSNYNNGFRLVRVAKNARAAALVPVEVTLPRPVFVGTEKDLRAPNTKPVQKEPGPPFLAPEGTRNVALGKPVSSSDAEPVIGEIGVITDGDKEACDGSFVELAPLLQHVTIDLQGEYEIYGIRAWHYHLEPRVYFDVIVQISSDPDFITGVKTIFNNDLDNSAGLGVGRDKHYVDTHFGEIFDAKGHRGRYVRLHSRGNTSNDMNHYIEVEVYGK